MNERPTFGSLFAGIGGLDLGLERADWRCAWQVESDPDATAVLAHHWPDVPRCGDIRTVDVATLAHVDLICGGFPCQDISSAGKGLGLDGARSGLWWEMWRLIRDLRPRWVLAENVPPLRTRGADEVLGALEALGYTCWPLVVGARHVGAPHRRDRVWIVGQLADADAGGDAQHERECEERAAFDARGDRMADASSLKLRLESGGGQRKSRHGSIVARIARAVRIAGRPRRRWMRRRAEQRGIRR